MSNTLTVVAEEASRLHDDLLKAMPSGARHDTDNCPFCVESASTTPVIPPVVDGTGDSIEDSKQKKGGTLHMSNEISRETHDALLEKALKDSTSELQSNLEAVTKERDEIASQKELLAEEVAAKKEEIAKLGAENNRIQGELDAAQVQLKSAQDEANRIAAEAALAATAAKRADEVAKLGLFGEEYIADKAGKWAGMSEDDWADRLDEWKNLRPVVETQEADSAMLGSTESLTKESTAKVSALRAALGLD
jgi:uncharacterized protein YoxC